MPECFLKAILLLYYTKREAPKCLAHCCMKLRFKKVTAVAFLFHFQIVDGWLLLFQDKPFSLKKVKIICSSFYLSEVTPIELFSLFYVGVLWKSRKTVFIRRLQACSCVHGSFSDKHIINWQSFRVTNALRTTGPGTAHNSLFICLHSILSFWTHDDDVEV